ncbi:MAG: hypothetical protein QXH30_01480 [Candidatus Bilamarchaeaceae archaeon]
MNSRRIHHHGYPEDEKPALKPEGARNGVQRREKNSALREEIIPGKERFSAFIKDVPLSTIPYMTRAGAEKALLSFARRMDMNPRQLQNFVLECIRDRLEGEVRKGDRALERFSMMLSTHFEAELSGHPHTTIAEFGKDFGEGTYYGTSWFVDMVGFSSKTKEATGQTIGMLMHAQDLMLRLAGLNTGTSTDNFTGDGRNTDTIKATKFKSIVDATVYGLMVASLVERFNKINMQTRELGMLEGKELQIRQGMNYGEISIRETSGRHTTYSAATNLAARIMGHAELMKPAVSEGMARELHRHFRLRRRELGQTVREEIERIKGEARALEGRYGTLGAHASGEEKRGVLLELYARTYLVKLLSDLLDESFGGGHREKNREWVDLNDAVEGRLRSKEILGEFALTKGEVDRLKVRYRDETNKNPEYSRSLKGFKGFKEIGVYYIVDGVRGCEDNPYLFPLGSRIRKDYIEEGKGRALEEYVAETALPYGVITDASPHMFFPFSILETDMLDGEVGSSMGRTVMAVCSFRELVKKAAASEKEETEGTVIKKVREELEKLGAIDACGNVDEEKMREVEREYVLLPSLLLEIGKCRIADEMFGDPREAGDERASKRVARTHTVLTSNPAIIGNLLEDEQMKKLNEIPRISARMLRKHNERCAGGKYFKSFGEPTIMVIENTETGKKWREMLELLEGKAENPALTLMSSQIIGGCHSLVRGIMGMPWSQTFEPVDTVLESTLIRYGVNRRETVHREVCVILRDLLSSPVSYKVYWDSELFPEQK